MRVGLIGVGLMGHGIAANLLKAGHALSFLDHPGNQPTGDLVEGGAVAASTPRAVAEGAEAVILCVTGAPQVGTVMRGPEGVLAGLAEGSVVIDCTTSLPDMSVAMAAETAAVGGIFLDAPMTRTAAHAAAGTLNLLVGGEKAALDRVAPMLDAFTENVAHVGPVGTGHRMKLLHNYVSIGFMTLLAEAAAQAADAGVDPATFVKVLGEGGGASAALDRFAPYITDSDTSGLPFAIANGLKDIDYYGQMSDAAGARDGIARAVKAAIEEAVSADEGETWLPELVRIFRR